MTALILLPPSKTTAPGGDRAPLDPDAGPLGAPRRAVVDAYLALTGDEAAFGTAVDAQGDVLDAALIEARELLDAPTAPAGARYTGLLHEAAGWSAMRAAARRRYAGHVRVLSGLLGVTRPDEAIPSYRLPMGARLDGLGPLGAFWRPHVTAALEAEAGDDLVWDLCSAEYQRAIDPRSTLRRVVVRFERPDGRAAPSAIGKQAKGRLAAHLAAVGPGDLGAVEDADVLGHRFVELREDGPRPVVVLREGA
ncbi:MAG: YaaA family protein [Actinomycetes bacterium]